MHLVFKLLVEQYVCGGLGAEQDTLLLQECYVIAIQGA